MTECVCGRELVRGSGEHHMVAEAFRDDSRLADGMVAGATAVIADFCPDDCPGGCQQGCPLPRPEYPNPGWVYNEGNAGKSYGDFLRDP